MASSTSSPRPLRRGFTLTEILIAMAIFAIGGVSIIALFITNGRISRKAMDLTRATEITRNIRAMIANSMNRPITLTPASANQPADVIYRFDYPGASLTFTQTKFAKLERPEGGRDSTAVKPDDRALDLLIGTPRANAIYFRLPVNAFDARIKEDQNTYRTIVTSLPDDGLDAGGSPQKWNVKPEVYRLVPDRLREGGAAVGVDPDDRVAYSFSVSIRRAVSRAGVKDPQQPGVKMALEDLYSVHVRIFRGFVYAEENGGQPVLNEPFYEWDFLVNASR